MINSLKTISSNFKIPDSNFQKKHKLHQISEFNFKKHNHNFKTRNLHFQKATFKSSKQYTLPQIFPPISKKYKLPDFFLRFQKARIKSQKNNTVFVRFLHPISILRLLPPISKNRIKFSKTTSCHIFTAPITKHQITFFDKVKYHMSFEDLEGSSNRLRHIQAACNVQ